VGEGEEGLMERVSELGSNSELAKNKGRTLSIPLCFWTAHGGAKNTVTTSDVILSKNSQMLSAFTRRVLATHLEDSCFQRMQLPIH
jgi:hypothetical protein